MAARGQLQPSVRHVDANLLALETHSPMSLKKAPRRLFCWVIFVIIRDDEDQKAASPGRTFHEEQS